MAGALEKSADVMRTMQQLVKVPEIQATMQEMSKEMMKVHRSVHAYGILFHNQIFGRFKLE